MTKNRSSIRKRLLFILMGTLVLISILMLIEVKSSARIAANEAYDRVLLGSALAISERVLIVGEHIDVDIPYVALEMLASESQDRIFYQVTTQDHSFVTGYEDLPPLPKKAKPIFDEPLFYDAIYKGDEIRIGAINRFISSPKLSTRFTVRVAETTDARNSLIQKMVTDAILRQFILIFVAGCIMWVGVSWGLKPLRHLQAALKRRNPKDLHPIAHKVPQEVQQLVNGINDLMDRLSQSIEAMQRFTSNAAHQLRTPLAAIQTQTELALKTNETDELHHRLEHLKQSTQQSTRLVNQLLSLARAMPDQMALLSETIDIVKTCREITAQLVPHALEKGMDLGFECETDKILILGHEGLLQEALKNLIENAIAYCPKETEITVKVFHENKIVTIEVHDTGLGIPSELQDKIFERFNRGSRSDGNGCGLGLSIVKEIVERHSGHITLISEPQSGTTFCITLQSK